MRPADLAPGDVMVAALAARTATGGISPPPGWTLIRRDMSGNVGAELSQALYLRVSGPQEPSDYSWTFESPVSANGAILAYRGISRAQPVDRHSGRYTPDAARFTAPSVRTSRRGDLVLAFFGSTGTHGITPPKGMVERFDLAGADLQLEAATYVMREAGATGAKHAADSASEENSSSFGQLVALRSVCSTMTGRPRAGERPNILGSAYVGRRVTAFSGTWCGKRPIRLSYQWQRCGATRCTSIKGATGTSYTPRTKDLDASLTFTVTARSSAGTTTVKSRPKGVGRTRPTNTALPTISGTAQQGFELTASPGSWTGLEPMTYAYQWQRCDSSGSACAAVPGASNPVYLLAAADVGATMRVVVTATNSSGSKPASSSPTAIVAAAPSAATAPTNTALPAVSGGATQGATLSGSTGGWAGTTPISYAYAWQRCDSAGASCASVTGATAPSYLLAAADVGSTIRLVVTASNTAGSSSAASLPTAVVAATASPPLNIAVPSITGAAEVGSLLTASTGTWTGTTPIGYTYQWRRCDQAGANCSSISGATDASYKVTYADGGSTLRLLVTAVNAVGSNVAISNPTAVVPVVYPPSFFTGPLGANNILPPKAGAFLGIAPQGSWAEKQNQVMSREQFLGRRFDFVHVMYGGAPAGTCYSTALFAGGWEKWVADRGSMPFVSWTHGWTLDEVNAGLADACLGDVGKRFAAWGRPILLRPYWEFNGTWFRWSGTGAKFISAWKRTVDVMRSAGATNVGFVWCPDEGNYAGTNESYPGDNYVDWVCSDKFNWNKSTAYCRAPNGTWHAGWCEFEESFRDGSSIESLFGPRKPYMVGETASVEDPLVPGRKGKWHLNARDAIKARFPHLRAYLYFDAQWAGVQWPVDTSISSYDAFREMAVDPYFNTR